MPKVVGYFGVVASMKALSRRQKDRKLMHHPELRELVIERIKDGWTPERIAGRLIYENAPIRICQETIYRFVYSAEGMKEDLWWYLPEHRRKRRPRKGRAPKKPKISAFLLKDFQRASFGLTFEHDGLRAKGELLKRLPESSD